MAAMWLHAIWRLDQWRMEYMKKNGDELPKNLDVSRLSADEVDFRTVRPEEIVGQEKLGHQIHNDSCCDKTRQSHCQAMLNE